MTAPYLPKVATLEQAQAWLEHETGEQWPLARLIEQTAIMPWVWLDYSAEAPPEVFAGRLEGYLAPMLFAGDTQRLAAGADDVVLTMTQTPDGRLFQMAGMRCPLSELRFVADDLRENVRVANGASANTESLHSPSEPCVTKKDLIDGLKLIEPKWEDILKKPESDGRRYLPAMVSKGRRGRAADGKTNSALWNPITFVRIAVENDELNKSAAVARFIKYWPQWQDELSAEMG